MEALLSLFPITVVVAVTLFMFKELIEGIRRYRGDRRRNGALRLLLARECELNHWTVKSIRHIIQTIRNELEIGSTFEVVFPKSGTVLFRVNHQHSKYKSGSALAETHRHIMNENLLDAATLDKKLYAVLRPACDAVAELEHVRQSLIYYLSPEDDQDQMHLNGFLDYALDELEDVFRKLSELYRECTGEDLLTHRLR